MFDDIMAEQKVFIDEMNEWKKKKQEEGTKLFKAQAAKIFELFPKLFSFGWNQYTPYYCDGDACVFQVNYDDVEINDQSIYDYKNNSSEIKTGEQISGWLGKFDNDLMEHLFGDGVKVTMNRDGTTKITNYEHD